MYRKRRRNYSNDSLVVMAWLLCVQEEKEDLQQRLFSCDGLAVVCRKRNSNNSLAVMAWLLCVQEEKEELQQRLFSCDGLAVVCTGR